jgi:hypothetical protein
MSISKKSNKPSIDLAHLIQTIKTFIKVRLHHKNKSISVLIIKISLNGQPLMERSEEWMKNQFNKEKHFKSKIIKTTMMLKSINKLRTQTHYLTKFYLNIKNSETCWTRWQ